MPIKLCQKEPFLSHIFFADGLVLSVESKIDQANVIKGFLNDFYACSDKKMSAIKTRIYFSKNIFHHKHCALGQSLGFQATTNLENYLGVPLYIFKFHLPHMILFWIRL